MVVAGSGRALDVLLHHDYTAAKVVGRALHVSPLWFIALSCRALTPPPPLPTPTPLILCVCVCVFLTKQDPLCTPALRTLGNMVSGNEAGADAVMVHKEFLPCLDAVLKNQVQQQYHNNLRQIFLGVVFCSGVSLHMYQELLSAPAVDAREPTAHLSITPECVQIPKQ